MSYDEDILDSNFNMDMGDDLDDASFDDEEMEGMHFTDEDDDYDPEDKFH